ncbi:MAG: hypothetical protein KH704_15730 [Clostridiales bacterium]|jgi:hypothetical protein|nr:hypothetical protein [Clostridiales bacterium]
MSLYDLASAEGASASAALARIRAAQEPDQSSYNAAWLHGYADGLTRAVDLLESQQEFLAAFVDCVKEQYGSTGLYEILRDVMEVSDKDILALGLDVPQNKTIDLEKSAGKRNRRRKIYDER